MRDFEKLILTAVFAIPMVTWAGVWEADPSNRYSLDASASKAGQISAADRAWAESVPSRVGAADPEEWRVLIFVRSAAAFTHNGDPIDDSVFVREDDPDEFLVFAPRGGAFLVEFGRPGVSSLYCGGVSGHRHPSRRLAVLLVPVGAPFYRCVPVHTAILSDRKATWH